MLLNIFKNVVGTKRFSFKILSRSSNFITTRIVFTDTKTKIEVKLAKSDVKYLKEQINIMAEALGV